MKVVHIDPSQDIPIIDAILKSSSETARARLVFDTGSGLTQIDIGLIEELGYSAKDSHGYYHIQGPAGESVSGYKVRLKNLSLFGKRIEELEVGAIDFDNFSHFGISGLLGYDVIKTLHIELNGPVNTLNVF